jgi:galactose-1-phosphate uridylyltransferase
MRSNRKWLDRMPDGTIKQINPFTGTEVWTVPGRAAKPTFNAVPASAKPLPKRRKEDYCHFCETRLLETPPEKSRLVRQRGECAIKRHVLPAALGKTTALFRRIPNLFEIVSFDYWEKNYEYELPPALNQWKEAYLSDAAGLKHVLDLLRTKWVHRSGNAEPFDALSLEEKLKRANAFFGGGHEVIVAQRHFVRGATHDNQLCSSGDLTPDEHYEYFRFTVDALREILGVNRYARYVSVFQNWLAPAGASINHLHKQLVTIDEWGTSVEREIELVRHNPNLYNECAANFASYQNLVIAENDHAIAFADIGHRHPALAIYSKSERCHPWEQEPDEVRGFSDLVHACHAAMGNALPCNEEWYYKPPDATVEIPWHILIKWRLSTPAGFEGGTKIYINTVDPYSMRDQMVDRMFALKRARRLARFNIAFECPCKPNSLRYNPELRRGRRR